MLRRTAHNAGERIRRIARRGPLRSRLLIPILIVQLLAIAVVAAFAIILLLHEGNPPSEVNLSTANLIFILVIATFAAICSTLAIAAITTGILNKQIALLTALVRQQEPGSELTITLETDREDEIQQLVDGLNTLLQTYHHRLDDLGRRASRLGILNLIAATINRTFDLEEVFTTTLREVLGTIGWDAGAIYMWDEQAGILNMVGFAGLSEETVRRLYACRLDEGVIGQAARTRQMIVVSDIHTHPAFVGQETTDLPVTQVSIPLVTVPGELLGVFIVGSAQKATLTEDELNLLATVAHQLAHAIDKALLYGKVKQHARELERIVQARTEELARAIDDLSVALQRAQEADKVKSLLLSTVSHELRTPLATIKGNATLLIEHHEHFTSDMLVQHLRDIEEETDKLTELISNLLEMSRIEAGVLHIEREPIDLKTVLEDAVAAAQIRLEDHPIQLNMPKRLPIGFGDARRVEQIVANLLDNAAKHSPVGSPIEVQCRCNGEELVVAVTDRGEGIAPEHLEHIFDRFYQVTNRGDSYRHGIGLGLAICRGLVEAQEGRIWVESQVGKGSTFSFSLPLATPERLQGGSQHG